MQVDETSLTMLQGLKDGDAARWRRFQQAYEPFIRGQFSRLCNADDAQELTQEVLIAIVGGISDFARERAGSFRAWLRTIARRTASKFVDKRRADRAAVARLSQLADAMRDWDDAGSELSQRWDRDHETYWAQRLMEELRNRHSDRDCRVYLKRSSGVVTSEVATEFALRPQAVFVIVGRVRATMNRLREEWSDMLEG